MHIQQMELMNGSRHMICWLPRDPRVKPGSVISLVRGGERWLVLCQYGMAEYQNIHRDWNAGGIKSSHL